MAVKRNARAEAGASLGPNWRPLVLEPSPPAVLDEPYCADDPLQVPDGEGLVITPLGTAPSTDMVTWTDIVAGQPDLALFTRERWLAVWPRLKRLPDTFAETRLALHRVAAYVVSPARRRVNDKIGLRYTKHGFGTPFFSQDVEWGEADCQVRVEGAELVDQSGNDVRSTPLTTLNEMASFLSMAPDVEWASEFDVPDPGGLDDDLVIDVRSARSLADWFGFAFSVLEELRADEASVDATRPQLWPEHFDAAIEIGSDDLRQRGSYGLSPGDAHSTGRSEPYLYVSAWYPDELIDDPYWNAETFPGAAFPYAELIEYQNQRGAALDFFRAGRRLILGDPQP